MSEKRKILLKVEGMSCDSCAAHVTHGLERVPGVLAVQVPGWRSGQAEVLALATVEPEELVRAVETAGYRATVQKIEVLPNGTPEEGPEDDRPDLLVIGGGSAGFAAAIRAAELGARILMVNRGPIGGTCVNVGCVPSKALIRAMEAYHQAGHHGFRGVSTSAGSLWWPQVIGQKDELVRSLRKSKYVDVLAAYPQIRFVEGTARFIDPHTVEVNGTRYRPHRVVIATGARPWVPPIPGLEEARYLTSTEALSLRELPRSLIVIGANAVGLELAQVYARAGTAVTVLEAQDRIAPFEEPEISEALQKYLEAEGMVFYTGVRVTQVERPDGECYVTLEAGGKRMRLCAEEILVATGRQANTEDLNLEAAGVRTGHRGAILVDPTMRTSMPHIYAAGDCTQLPMFVYVAAYGGKIAAENALRGETRSLDLDQIPRVIFTDPQVAAVGLTEAQAHERGIRVRTTLLPLSEVPRALVSWDTRGLIKLVAEEDSGRLLGAHILAPEAGEAIQTATLALRYGATLQDLTETLFPYLTLVEGLKLAALSFEKDVHKLSCCAG